MHLLHNAPNSLCCLPMKWLLLVILLPACAYQREAFESKAIASLKKDLDAIPGCYFDFETRPKITLGKEAFYDWLANEIQYPSGDRLALEHELHHYFNKNASKRCLDNQVTHYRTLYLNSQRALRREKQAKKFL